MFEKEVVERPLTLLLMLIPQFAFDNSSDRPRYFQQGHLLYTWAREREREHFSARQHRSGDPHWNWIYGTGSALSFRVCLSGAVCMGVSSRVFMYLYTRRGRGKKSKRSHSMSDSRQKKMEKFYEISPATLISLFTCAPVSSFILFYWRYFWITLLEAILRIRFFF